VRSGGRCGAAAVAALVWSLARRIRASRAVRSLIALAMVGGEAVGAGGAAGVGSGCWFIFAVQFLVGLLLLTYPFCCSRFPRLPPDV
jgi:hypothetical protein